MTIISQFDRTVSQMMRQFGSTAILQIATLGAYDPSTSEASVTYQNFQVNAVFLDYVRKAEGLGEEKNTLVQSGDKQVYIQPPQKATGVTMPVPKPNKDLIKINGVSYKIVTVKQFNTSMTAGGAVLYELYVRE
jgi:hypothetical protein